MTVPPRLRHYEVRRELGRGAFGVVYEAFDTRLLRPVVLKTLLEPAAGAAGLLEEARLASAIEHPNVCAIYEVVEEPRPCIVMQFVRGRPLASLLEEGPQNLPLAVSAAIQLADGLAAAHALDIVHRDLKPSNVMISDTGVIKILDFGLARRRPGVARGLPGDGSGSAPLGTLGYMAPEQLAGGRSSAQSDIYALGVILYTLVAGRHPFAGWSGPEQIKNAVQYGAPRELRQVRPETPAELEGVVSRALAKSPDARWPSAGDLRDALRTALLTLEVDPAMLPGHAVSPAAERHQRRGVMSMLVERILRSEHRPPETSVAVLPFRDLVADAKAPLYGLALAEAISGRLARLPGVVVRPTTSAFALPPGRLDPASAGDRLGAAHLVEGSFLRGDGGFTLTWQLVAAATGAVRTGGSIQVPTLDLVAVQTEIGDAVYATLQGAASLELKDGGALASLEGEVSERYLEARALLTRFTHRTHDRADLERAEAALEEVVARASSYAPAVASLARAMLEHVRNGFGGPARLARAHELFERALDLDPDLREAKLFRVFSFLARGEKDSARSAVGHLLEAAADDFDVNVVAAFLLRLDGLYEPALARLAAALRVAPGAAHIVYGQRARLYHYQGLLDLALREVEKGLSLAPAHPLLRASLGYLHLRRGDPEAARPVLEEVLAEHPHLHIVAPTLAMTLARSGAAGRARALIDAGTLRAAEADGETAYRVATCYAVLGERDAALTWLRKAIALGNHTYPWFAANPFWEALRGDPDLDRVLAGLSAQHATARQRWRMLLGERR